MRRQTGSRTRCTGSACARATASPWLGRNGLVFPVVLLAARRAGVILTGLNWRLSSAELIRILDRTVPALIIGDMAFAGAVPGRFRFVDTESGLGAFMSGGSAVPVDRSKPGNISTLFFTSGTTGRTQGARLHE